LWGAVATAVKNKKSQLVQGWDFLIWRESLEDALLVDELNVSALFREWCDKMHSTRIKGYVNFQPTTVISIRCYLLIRRKFTVEMD